MALPSLPSWRRLALALVALPLAIIGALHLRAAARVVAIVRPDSRGPAHEFRLACFVLGGMDAVGAYRAAAEVDLPRYHDDPGTV